MRKRKGSHLVKRHRNYTMEDAARCLGVAKITVRNWIKKGLPVLKDQRPFLIIGSDLIDFLDSQKQAKQKCGLVQCYCFKCRAPRNPAYNEVEFLPSESGGGNLRALCNECTTVMHKRVSLSNLSRIQALTTVFIAQAETRLSNSAETSLNYHLKRGQ